MSIYEKYEPVIGLEVHMQLLTNSKAYSSDSTQYGNLPNTNVTAISLGHPGTLPMSNKRVVEFAVRLGIAVKATIREENQYARKNYFYADLPKGYQITQDKTPICNGGYIPIRLSNGTVKNINLTRIHMEEDAGKSMHDIDPNDTLIDLNRAGVPLLEMVSEPEIKSGEEANLYLSEVRKLIRYLDICDGNMEEGSMRCDANISVMLKGSNVFGNKVEVKNMNSIRNVQRAIEYEIKRQIELLEAGERVAQDTRSFDAGTGTTFSMRSKEDANDYRYFPEPDLQPVFVTAGYVEKVKSALPPLPNELIQRYTIEYGLSEYDALVLTEQKAIANYFNQLISHTNNYKAAGNWVMGTVKSYLNEAAITIEAFPIPPAQLAKLIHLIDEGKISNTVASQVLFPKMLTSPGIEPLQMAINENLIQESDDGALQALIDQAIAKYPEKVEEYKQGKVGLLGLFMGEVMKLSKGKADPKKSNELMKQALAKLVIIALIFSSCHGAKKQEKSTNGFDLKGKLENAVGQQLYLEAMRPTGVQVIDTANVNDKGEFHFEHAKVQLGFYRLRLTESNFLMMVLDSSQHVTLEADAKSLVYSSKVEGSPDTKLFNDLNETARLSFQRKDSIMRAYEAFANGHKSNKAELEAYSANAEKQFNQVVDGLNGTLLAFIQKNPSSLVSVVALQWLSPEKSTDGFIGYYAKVDSMLTNKYPHAEQVSLFHKNVQGMLHTQLGALAPDFTLSTPEGKNLTLSDFKGKVVVIDFWASWCSPCRVESPNMVKLYQQVHPKGVEFIGVSLDNDPVKWKEAISKDKLAWNHGSELKGWKSEVVKAYTITQIPNTYLIDKSGRIVAKGLRADELAEKIVPLIKQ